MIAFIVNEPVETPEYQDDHNFHLHTIFHLIQSGYNIVICRPRNAEELKAIIEAQEDGSIGVIIVRAHGTPKSITLMPGWKLTPENVPEIFALLGQKCAPGVLTMLDACSTGKYAYKSGEFGKKEDCIDMDNMAMAFAKTAGGDMRVIAPTFNSNIGGMIRVGAEWKFVYFGAPTMYSDISACFDRKGLIDRDPLLYHSHIVPYLRRAIPSSHWNTAVMIVTVIIEHHKITEPMTQVRSLLGLLAPEQMFDGKEHVYMDLDSDHASVRSSCIIKCLSEATINMRRGIFVWLQLPHVIQEWADEHGCGNYVDWVVDAFPHSPLGRELARK